ncbi:MAG TPA: beta-propeller domain-containing protein [Iamia sp.]
MNDRPDPTPPTEDDDAVLAAAGARLRQRVGPIPLSSIERAAQRRRLRRLGGVAAAAVLVALLGGVMIGVQAAHDDGDGRPGSPSGSTDDEVDRLVASLDDQPVDPTDVQLVSSVSTFADCDALIGDLRRVAAEHVGSRGFGGFGGLGPQVGEVASRTSVELLRQGDEFSAADGDGGGGGETLGTNVQVTGVDELDHVKAEGDLVYDVDGKGNLRITDAGALEVLSTLDVTPGRPPGEDGSSSDVSDLLVADGTVVVFGSEVEVSAPVEGDPSATQAAVGYMTVTFVDATDPARPTITDRVRIEGGLVAARLVDGEIRLVTTSNMADLGFVMPTTPASVPTALDQNRRVAAASTAGDWIPDWQRDGDDPEPLVPCERVHVPDTFSGVAMTSMVTFPIGTGRFDPTGTSMLAPGATLYAGLDRVAISSEVWVDPIDRDRLEFDDWQTAIHEFSFTDDAAPSYDGSGIVDGSTVGQFAFGEIGESLAVVTTEGTPWQQEPDAVVDLTVLTPDGEGALDVAAPVEDLADGSGAVTAVRFVEGRVLVSTGLFGRVVSVIDVTDPAAPRRAGSVTVPGDVGYFHPLPDGRALVVGTRTDEVGEGDDRQTRSWVVAQLLDVSDADAPAIVSTWERPWSADSVGSDHHAFTYWPDRALAMWGLQDTQWNLDEPAPNHAVVLGVDGAVTEVAVPEASKPDEVAPPCPVVEVTEAEARQMLGPDGIALRCDDPDRRVVEWPRYQCSRVDDQTIARFAPGEEDDAAFFACSPAPQPSVARVLVVSGTPMLLTDQTLERLDPATFASTAVLYHPTAWASEGF